MTRSQNDTIDHVSEVCILEDMFVWIWRQDSGHLYHDVDWQCLTLGIPNQILRTALFSVIFYATLFAQAQ